MNTTHIHFLSLLVFTFFIVLAIGSDDKGGSNNPSFSSSSSSNGSSSNPNNSNDKPHNLSGRYQEIIEYGDTEYNGGEFSRANDAYKAALSYASTESQRDYVAQKIDTCSKMLKHLYFQSYLDSAGIYYDNKVFDYAKKMYEKALNAALFDSEILQIKQRISDCEDILKKEASDALKKRGDDFSVKKEIDSALVLYKKALELYPNDSILLNNVRRAESTNKQYTKYISEGQRKEQQGREWISSLSLSNELDHSLISYKNAYEIKPNKHLNVQISRIKKDIEKRNSRNYIIYGFAILVILGLVSLFLSIFKK